MKKGRNDMQVENNVIQIRGLKKSYKRMEVLKGVDLNIKKGSIFCLLGSNGAGKTTMVKILATLLKADSGEVILSGCDVKENPEQVRSVISLTGQYAAVDGLLTARENLRMVGRLNHINNVKAKTDQLLREFNLEYAADRPVSTFSGGMRRRLDIAMSLIGNPEIIFLDEPTTGLDPQSRIEMWKIIREMAGAGVTVFLTTQYIEEAEQLANHIAVLHEGIIIAQGSAQELKSKLAGGAVLLGFEDTSSYITAQQVLKGCSYKLNDDTLTIEVATDGSVKQMANLLSNLNGTNIAYLEQKQASLEDVFLTLVAN